MDWRVTAVDAFYDSLAQFGDSEEVGDVAEELIMRLLIDPLRVEPIAGLTVRALRGGTPGGPIPALRLVYSIRGDEITLLRLDSDEPRAVGDEPRA
jgi:hypothetical protein